MSHLADSPLSSNDIRIWSRRDPKLSQVIQFFSQGWPETCDPSLKVFQQRKSELSLHAGCVLWGSRVMVPVHGRKMVLPELHEDHPGMTKMKSLAQMYVWWPRMEKDIEQSVQSCVSCQVQQSLPPVAPLQPWSWPTRAWSRLHLDYVGPFQGHMFLVLVDAHSKWIEVFPTTSATSSATIEHLHTVTVVASSVKNLKVS